MREVIAMAFKDLKILFRDKFGLFWIFAFPLLFAIFFGSIFGGDDDDRQPMRIAIVDDAENDASRKFIERLDKSKSVSVTRRKDGTVRDYALDEAKNLVRRGNRVAFIQLKPSFEAAGFSMFAGNTKPAIAVGIDPSRTAEAGFLQGVLMEATFGGLTESFSDTKGMQERIAKSREEVARATDIDAKQKTVLDTLFGSLDTFMTDVDFEAVGEPQMNAGSLIETVSIARDEREKPRSPFDVTFPSAIIWGLMGCITGFSISIVRERVGGTLLRLKVAPVSRAQLLAGKGLSCFLMCCIVAVALLALGTLVFGVRIGSPAMLALGILCTATCFTGMMMTIALMGKTEQAVAGAGWGVMMPLAMLGGGMVPLIAMPGWMLKLSNISPIKWGIVALEGGVWRDFSLQEMLLPCGILVAIGVLFFTLGVFIFQRAEA